MAWIALLCAGVLEVAWTLLLKLTDGFSKPLPSALTLLSIGGSVWLLGVAARTLPIGTAYSVWVGIGVLGAVIGGAVFYDEPLSVAQIVLLVVLAGSIVGLKLTAPAH